MKKNVKHLGRSLLMGALIASALGQAAVGQTVTAPPQPASGPGSNQYSYGVLQSGPFVVPGQNKKSGYTYYTYTPVGLPPSQTNPNPLPTPKTAPVVLFISAEDNGATVTSDYLFLLEQITSMGFTVVFPDYTSKEKQADYVTVVKADLKDSLNTLTTNSTLVKPALDSNGKALLTIVGHSQGAYLAFELASIAVSTGLPVPKAIVSFEANPGKLATVNALAIDPNTLVILVVGDQDKKDRICPSVALWSQMTQISNVYKPFLYARSDSHGTPAQLGNHWFPLTYTKQDTDPPPTAVDDRDWNITYKLSVAATACTINGQFCDYAIGNGPLNGYGVTTQTDMGFWSDGALVMPLVYEINPVNAFSTLSCKLN